MARALYPAAEPFVSSDHVDRVREAAERAALIECARRTKKKVFLKAGPGPDTAEINAQLVNDPDVGEVIARALLPDTDLNAGGVAYDQWLTAALVAGTESPFVAQALLESEVVVIYGIATLDANPGISRVRCLRDATTVLALWDSTNIWAAGQPMGISDEFPMWRGSETVNIFLMPFLTKAGGERFVLLGFQAEPKGANITK